MNTFNAIFNAIFDVLLGWFGGASGAVDILLWSLGGGIVALIVYKWVSNQAGIEKAKNDIKVHLLEIRLFQDDIVGVLASTGKILIKNALYIGHNIVPMLVMFVPMMAILFQLEAHYALDPMPVGTTTYLNLTLDRDAAPDLAMSDIRLEAPPGVRVAGMVAGPRTQVCWKIVAEQAGDHELVVHLGDEQVTKGLAVGGEPRKVPYMRTKSWEGYLYPGEAGLDADSAAHELKFQIGDSNGYPDRDLGFLPGGEFGVLMTFFLVSIAAGLALKGVFGVTL